MPNQLPLPLDLPTTQEEIDYAISLIPGLCHAYKGLDHLSTSGYFETKSFEKALDESEWEMFEAVAIVMERLHPEIARKYVDLTHGCYGYDVDLQDEFEKLYGI